MTVYAGRVWNPDLAFCKGCLRWERTVFSGRLAVREPVAAPSVSVPDLRVSVGGAWKTIDTLQNTRLRAFKDGVSVYVTAAGSWKMAMQDLPEVKILDCGYLHAVKI
jgi:hypothetical protein